jgi:hypothetical protein
MRGVGVAAMPKMCGRRKDAMEEREVMREV